MATISNNHLTIEVNTKGAELASIKSKKTGIEYLWQAAPKFWNRHSPVLFPFVGKVWDGRYRTNEGKEYQMPQHGFARDMNFELISQGETSVMYLLKSNDETLEKYPYNFELYIGYKLNENTIEVIWEVKNTGTDQMYFQIGAHPAFNYPDLDANSSTKGYFNFDTDEEITYKLLGEKDCLNTKNEYTCKTIDALFPIRDDSFAKGALIIENSQLKTVRLLDKNKKQYIALHFDAPVVGLWSPNKEDSPFVCIEPWYGRCDSEYFEGNISQRDWINKLNAEEKFSAKYIIEVE